MSFGNSLVLRGAELEGHRHLFNAAPKCPMKYDLLTSMSEPPGTLGEDLESVGAEVRNGELPRLFLKLHLFRRKEDTDPVGSLLASFSDKDQI